jgi:hypothetical protein
MQERCKWNSNILFTLFSRFENIHPELRLLDLLRIIYAQVESCTRVINLRTHLTTEQGLYLAETFTPCES